MFWGEEEEEGKKNTTAIFPFFGDTGVAGWRGRLVANCALRFIVPPHATTVKKKLFNRQCAFPGKHKQRAHVVPAMAWFVDSIALPRQNGLFVANKSVSPQVESRPSTH